MARDSGFTNADFTQVVATLPQYYWIRTTSQLKTEWRNVRISKHNEGVMLTYSGSNTAYYFKFLGECIEFLHKMARYEQIGLDLNGSGIIEH